MDPGPLGTLGVGAPFALAAQLAHPDKRVVIVYGDGSFGLNGFEFDTAVRFGLPIIGVRRQRRRLGPDDAAAGRHLRLGPPRRRRCSTTRATTRWWRRSAATASTSSEPEQIRPALDRAAASGKPALVNVIIRQDREYKGGIYV